MRVYRRLLNIPYKDHFTFVEVCRKSYVQIPIEYLYAAGIENKGANRNVKMTTLFSSCLNKNYISDILINCIFQNEHGQ